MFASLSELVTTWRAWRSFEKLPESRRRLVIYSEGPQDWPHIGPMVARFLELTDTESISFLSSGKSDPGLRYRHPRFESFYLGSGAARTLFFKFLRAKLLLMSLPDLEIYHLKRSAVWPVHYVYCFHSINSSHTVYRSRAFEFYDTLLCVGPHHVAELRKEEELKGLKPRRLLEHGSVKLDTVSGDCAALGGVPPPGERPLVLLAPSWGVGGFAEDRALVRALIQGTAAGSWDCRLRLHPMTTRHHPRLMDELLDEFAALVAAGRFAVEDDLNDNSSLRRASVMVSDWSGAATEFAFGFERPVLFINTPQKLNNPNWRDFRMPGLEESIRHQIGVVVEPADIGAIPDALAELVANSAKYQRQIAAAREEWIFNVGGAAEAGARHLLDLLAE